MRARRKTPHAAWHKIRTTITTEKFDLFAAFEGEEDEEFYTAYIYRRDEEIRIFPVICDGKGPLLALYDKVRENYDDMANVFFFLDSDHDEMLGQQLPTTHCFKTDGYSFESYGLSEDVAVAIVEKNFGLHPTDPLLQDVRTITQEAFKVFRRRARTIMTYVLLLRRMDLPAEVDNLHFHKLFQFEGDAISTKRRSFEWVSRETASCYVASFREVLVAARSVREIPDACIIRGKMVAQFLIRFMKCLARTLRDRQKINGKMCTVRTELGGGNFAQQLSTCSEESERLARFLDDLLFDIKGGGPELSV